MAGTSERERSVARDFAPAILLFAFGALLVAGLPWPCPLHLLTGIPCPSCGLTRATRLALHGDFAGATRMHPLWFIVVPACVVAIVGECVELVRTGSWGQFAGRRAVKVSGTVIVALLVVVWGARWFGAFGGPVP